MTGAAAIPGSKAYSKAMLVRHVISGLPLLALPAAAADSSISSGVTGVTVTGTSLALFALALALVASLLLKQTVSILAERIAARIGEWRLHRSLGKRGAKVLSDFIVPGAYGGLARIDHAVLTSGGILCIRTVHRNGVVFGGEDDAQWTHVDGVSRRRFLNPQIQNEGRRRALANIVPDAPVDNLVVFTGKVEFPNPAPGNVIHVSKLDSYIAKHVFGPSKVDDWDATWMTLTAAAMTDEPSRRDFAAQLSFS